MTAGAQVSIHTVLPLDHQQILGAVGFTSRPLGPADGWDGTAGGLSRAIFWTKDCLWRQACGTYPATTALFGFTMNWLLNAEGCLLIHVEATAVA